MRKIENGPNELTKRLRKGAFSYPLCPVTSLSYHPVPASPLTASALRLFNGLSGIREALTIPNNLIDMSNHSDFV